jgi:hypothetical protein
MLLLTTLIQETSYDPEAANNLIVLAILGSLFLIGLGFYLKDK